jgi:23S rRNA pseudouridine1911/1915/1917 synthase
MSGIGHPLAGDDMYGGSLEFINRQALHCGQVSFIHPVTKEKIEIFSELPADISELKRSDT